VNSQAFLSIGSEFYFLNHNRMQANVNPLTAGSNTTQRHDVIYTGRALSALSLEANKIKNPK